MARSFLRAIWRRGGSSATSSCSSPQSRTPRGSLGGARVVGQLMGMNAGQQFGAPPDVVDALAQKRAQGALLCGIDIGGRNQIGTEQVREFFGVDAVVLVFAPVNGFDVDGRGSGRER